MNKEFFFLIAIHFHQPVGNFDSVMERACQRCYEPFLEKISEFGDIKFNLHYSGCLLEWFEKHRPSLLKKIKELVANGQVELMGGGFYEPVLTILPRSDSVGQVLMLSEFLKAKFGAEPKGAWLAERVWEPQIASIFHDAGIKYTIVDDTHLRYSGLSQHELYGYYTTEDSGKPLSIFASDKFLRYAIPFHPQKETVDYFSRIMNEYGRNCAIYADDGEKFGEWPGTEKWVYKEKWLHNFLKLLSENSSWIKTKKISDYMKHEPPQGRIYIPTASYHEMGEWSLPAEAEQRFEDIIEELKHENRFDRYMDFMRGGFWRNFLVKYPESNQMHKRMLLVSERLSRLPAKTPLMKEAQKELYCSQCNCAYWHGIFGGLYLYHLRRAIYKHIIASEALADKIEKKKGEWVDIAEKDFDCDTHKELVVNTPKSTFIIDVNEGGSLTEWDIKSKSLNMINTLARRKEAYHRRLKELALQKTGPDNHTTIHDFHFSNKDLASREVIYDGYRRSSFIDHFISNGINLKDIICNRFAEQGDFAAGHYKYAGSDKRKVLLEKKGIIGHNDIKVIKQFTFYPDKDKIAVSYQIINLSHQSCVTHFAPEFNFSLTNDNTEEQAQSMKSLSLYDKVENLRVEMSFSIPADKVNRFSVKTVSQSERDIEEHYQSSCVMPVFGLKLEKDKARSIDITLEIK